MVTASTAVQLEWPVETAKLLSGELDNPQPNEAHAITTYHIGVVKDGGDWGRSLVDYMFSDAVAGIYASHGLRAPGSTQSNRPSLVNDATVKPTH